MVFAQPSFLPVILSGAVGGVEESAALENGSFGALGISSGMIATGNHDIKRFAALCNTLRMTGNLIVAAVDDHLSYDGYCRAGACSRRNTAPLAAGPRPRPTISIDGWCAKRSFA